MKKLTVLMIVVTMVLGLTACGNTVGDISLDAGQSAIYIQDDGSVSYAVAENFDKEYFDKGDLEEKIEEEVADYNSSSKASVDDAIDIDKFKVKSDVATLVLDFMTTYDFLIYSQEYNKVSKKDFYIGAIEDNTECKIKGDFVSPDKKETVDKSEIEDMTDVNILIVSEQIKVQIDGKVQFMSANCEIDEDGIITTAKSDDGKSYIIYK